MTAVYLTEEYRPRPIRFLSLSHLKGWGLKIYGVSYHGERPKIDLIQDAWTLITDVIEHQRTRRRNANYYKAAFVIIHEARGCEFVSICWWEDENVLHQRQFMRTSKHQQWITGAGLDTIIACIWDIRVMAFERDAWVASVLSNPDGPDLNAYFGHQLNEDV